MTVLLIAEHNNRNLKPVTAQVVTAALEMGGPVDVLVLGNDCRSIAEEAAKIAGVRTAYFADNPQFAQESPEAIAEIVVREGKGYDHILFVTGALGKTVMPRVAALMDVSPVSEILAVKGPKTFVRGMYAARFSPPSKWTNPSSSRPFAGRPSPLRANRRLRSSKKSTRPPSKRRAASCRLAKRSRTVPNS